MVSYDKLTTERLADANTCTAPSPPGTDRKEGGFLMPLTMAKPGETVTIRKITGRDQVKQHLAELGFVADSAVTVISEMGGSLILQVKESRVALDRSLANRVMI